MTTEKSKQLTEKKDGSKKDKKDPHPADDGHQTGENPVQEIQERIGEKNVAKTKTSSRQS